MPAASIAWSEPETPQESRAAGGTPRAVDFAERERFLVLRVLLI
jgi:hypothetical protein